MRRTCIALFASLAFSATANAAIDCARITVIAPYTAGGSTDVATRIVTERLEPLLKKPMVVENRTGASGNVGMVAVVQAKPDGCMLVVNGAVVATYPFVFSKLGYDPLTDLIPLGTLSATTNMFVTAKDNPINDVKALIEFSKTKPGGLTFATPGFGTPQHMITEEIARRTGAKFVHVPYRGGAPALTDLVTSRVDFATFSTGLVSQLMNDGKVKALAAIQEERSPLAPNVPTFKEAGVPLPDASVVDMTSLIMFAPAGTPKAIVDEYEAALKQVTSQPAVKAAFERLGFYALTRSSADAMAMMRKGGKDWEPIIKTLNVKMD